MFQYYPKKHVFLIFILMILAMPAFSEDAKVTVLMSKNLVGSTGNVGEILTVEFGPGMSSKKHRHPAHTFVYVLEGAVTMQIQGGDVVTLKAGQTFYESPNDIHLISKNASDTKPVKFLVFFIKEKEGSPSVIPVW
jgi:quercetin dioxygenase-like cupin family protein